VTACGPCREPSNETQVASRHRHGVRMSAPSVYLAQRPCAKRPGASAAVPSGSSATPLSLDAGALSMSLEEHRRFLYRYALSRVRHKETADEVVQDTLVAALEGIGSFHGDSSLRTWLTGILKHKVTDYQRRDGRTPVRVGYLAPADTDGRFDETEDGDLALAGDWPGAVSAGAGPEECYESARFWEAVERCLAALPPLAARAFYLREIEGSSTEEICAELGITANHCWVVLHRARMQLRRGLEERWFAPAASTAAAGVPPVSGPRARTVTRAGDRRARGSPRRHGPGGAETRIGAQA
jgi:RNA polymerase sigma-70 factor (ECF subfamily)